MPNIKYSSARILHEIEVRDERMWDIPLSQSPLHEIFKNNFASLETQRQLVGREKV